MVYLLPPAAGVTLEAELHRELMGQTAHQDFQVLGLWELDAGQMLAQGNPVLLPFVPLMQGGATKETLVACAERVRREPEGSELEAILAVFASYVLDAKLVKQLLRWEMTIITESPLIQELLIQEHTLGFNQGRQEGERNAILKDLHQILTIRFDTLPPNLEHRLEPLDLPTLHQLITAALTLPSLAAFESYIEADRQ